MDLAFSFSSKRKMHRNIKKRIFRLVFFFVFGMGNKYGKCSKISNTLKLRTPKIIAENNF